jgi:hypothetical protein
MSNGYSCEAAAKVAAKSDAPTSIDLKFFDIPLPRSGKGHLDAPAYGARRRLLSNPCSIQISRPHPASNAERVPLERRGGDEIPSSAARRKPRNTDVVAAHLTRRRSPAKARFPRER